MVEVKINPNQRPLNMNDLDKEFIKAQLKRNNSDTIRSKDELKTKKIILQELQDLKESLIYQQDQDKSEIDIGFLHASPIFIEGLNEGKTSLVPLKFQEEKKAIIEAIRKSGQQVRFLQQVATKDKFIEMIRKRPTSLHISCHGYDQTDTSIQLKREEDMRNLLFETENGDGKLMSLRELIKILISATTKIKVVFVAACMSQFVGEIFQQCDVPHVICSQQGKSILDEAAISFSKAFYRNMLKGDTICKAFQQAKEEVSVKFSDDEANRFQMMISQGQYKHKPKHCNTRWPQKPGDLDCRSEHIKFKHIRSKVTNFIPREIEFFKLVKYLQDEHKLVHFRGLPGIGKTHLVRNVLHYLSERKYFSAGILYFSLNDVKSASQFLIALRNRAIQFFKLSPQERFEFRQTVSSENSITDFMIEFFDDKALPGYELCKDKNFNKGENRRFLLALDNCEALIDKAGEEFQNLLSSFFDQCKRLKILVISRNQLGPSVLGEEIQPLILPQLGSKQAVQFFLDVLGPEKRSSIKTEEVVELILGSPFYPLSKALPNKGLTGIPQKITVEFRKDFTQMLHNYFAGGSDTTKVVEILSYHHLFKLLQGNPTSLSIAANVYLNPFENDVCSLLDLYKMVKQNNFQDVTYPGKENLDDTRPKPRLNNESLQATTKLAIDMLPCVDSKSLLYFIGCMPAGVTQQQLNEMWGYGKVEKDLPSLINMNLVEKPDSRSESEMRYELSPVLCQFIEQDISKESLEQFMKEIINHFAPVLKEVYKIVSFAKETEDEAGGESPDGVYDSSPRKQSMQQSIYSYNTMQDSLSIDQLSELTKGLKKKSLNVKNGMMSNLSSMGIWSTSDIKVPVQIDNLLKDWANLENCLEFLVNLNATISENSYINNNSQSGGSPAPDEMQVKLNESGKNIFSQSYNGKSSISGSQVLTNMQKKIVNNRRMTVQKRPGSSNINMLDRSSSAMSNVSSPLVTGQPAPNIMVAQISDDDSTSTPQNQRQASWSLQPVQQLRNKSIKQVTTNSHLAVIEETHEPHDQNITSQQSDEESKEERHPRTPVLTKDDSSPFSISLTPLDPQLSNKSKQQQDNSNSYKTKDGRRLAIKGPNEVNTMLSGMEKMLQQDSFSKSHHLAMNMTRQESIAQSLSDTIGKCDRIQYRLKERESFTRVQGGTLNDLARNDRPIFECLEDQENLSSSSEELLVEERHQNIDQAAASLLAIEKIPKLNINQSINVAHMNLDTDRSKSLAEETEEQRDPLASVRSGDDLEDDSNSRVSDFQHMASFNRDQLMKDIGISDNDPDTQRQMSYNDKSSLPNETDAEQFNNMFRDNNLILSAQDGDRRHTVNHMKRQQSAMTGHKFSNAFSQQKSASFNMKTHSKFMNKKQKKHLQELDQSAVFTLRRSGASQHHSPKGGQLNIPHRMQFTDQTPSPDSVKVHKNLHSLQIEQSSSILEKMTLYGQFVIYSAVNSYLMDDFAFCYQISSTNFEGIAGSILFLGNILRLKSLAAESIFVKYFDPKEEEQNLNLVRYIVEAIEAAQEALELYKGEQNGLSVGYANIYGIGLQNFQLGYLFEKYASDLSTQHARATFDQVCRDMTEVKFRERAREQFKKAFQNFEDMGHLKGMYLAKQHEAQLPEVSDDRQQRALNYANRMRRDYFEHVKKYGYENCCHIPRHHGEEISLLTEIVEQNNRQNLFWIPKEPKVVSVEEGYSRRTAENSRQHEGSTTFSLQTP